MATGGYVIAVPNGGNVEYLKDRENCLLLRCWEYRKSKTVITRAAGESSITRSIIRKRSKNGARAKMGEY